MRSLLLAIGLLAAGCAPTQYWVKPGIGAQQTAKDLGECRSGAGNVQVMANVENPCMVGKGYALSSTPTALP